ncbi:hypothetical protein Lser_V15G39180 [Lactuca serriola]
MDESHQELFEGYQMKTMIEMKTKSLTWKNQKISFPENSQESKGHAKSGKFDQVECCWLETQQESKGHGKRFLKFKKVCKGYWMCR